MSHCGADGYLQPSLPQLALLSGAEFRKTDRSILVSPMGASRVAFNPEQRPLHGVLKSPRSPASTTPTTKKLLLPTAQRRPRAMDFF